MTVKKYFAVDIGDTVFIVIGAKREGASGNCVLQATVSQIYINENGITYTGKVGRVVVGKEKDIAKYVRFLCFKDSNVDTGYHNVKYLFPVFTTKEKCVKWMKGE